MVMFGQIINILLIRNTQ